MNTFEILPWFAPVLSPNVTRVILNIGSRRVVPKGHSIGESAFFNRIVFVRRGFVAQGVINPGSSLPFMLTLAGANSFGIATNAVDCLDHLPRRYWAATHCEIFTVIPELLLRLSEVESSWNKELNDYAQRRAVSERLGLMVCQAADVHERLGVFLVAMYLAGGCGSCRDFESSNDWLRLPTPPSRKLLASVLSCRQSEIEDVLRGWLADGTLKFMGGGLFMQAKEFSSHWLWLKPFMRAQEEYAKALRPTTQVHVEFEL